MSFTEVHELTPKTKVLSGCGDGLTLTQHPQGSKRIPVPSCRRFATRPPVEEDANIKEKLERAIVELQTPRKQRKPRRKSLTMAEITPSKRKPKTNPDDGFTTDVDGATSEEKTASRRSQLDAGRRVYKLLLLNAWRRRRKEVAALAESLRQIKAQNNQLQIQADVLQKLRESECKRRDQAVNENGVLREEMNALLKINAHLGEEKKRLEERINSIDKEKAKVQTELQNARNDLLDRKAEAKSIEEMLQKERNKLANLREEVRILTGKIVETERMALIGKETIRKLKEQATTLEKNLQEEKLLKAEQEEINRTLKIDIEEEKEISKSLNKTVRELSSEKGSLEEEMQLCKDKLSANEADRDKLKMQNQTLRMQVELLKISLRNEKNKPWWVITKDALHYPLSLFKTAAFTMLPALPAPDSKISKSSHRKQKKREKSEL